MYNLNFGLAFCISLLIKILKMWKDAKVLTIVPNGIALEAW